MNNEEYEEKWFWETDGVYDLDGDLLVWSLMSVAMVSLHESIFMNFDFIECLNQAISLQSN
jgi:hypothetical protein